MTKVSNHSDIESIKFSSVVGGFMSLLDFRENVVKSRQKKSMKRLLLVNFLWIHDAEGFLEFSLKISEFFIINY